MVYVDGMRLPYRGMVMCHLVADSLDELHDFAAKLGLQKRYFQDKSLPHYDVSLSKREKAVKLGAKEVSAKEVARIARKCLNQENNMNVE